jgi:hypothetical protein
VVTGSACGLFNAGPSLTLTTSSSTICSGSTATLSAAGAQSYLWSNAAGNFSTAVSPTVTTAYTVTGTYSNNCNSQASIQQGVVICTGLNDTAAGEENLRVFPNPNNGYFIISSSSEMEIEILSGTGETVMNIPATPAYKTQQLTLPAGIYFARSKGSFQKAQKILVRD